MSTTVQNIVQRHTSTGAAKVQKDTEAIGKAQTRLGQASASAGRQFSAQATGLGGVVSAYAGAAANIFALTAAFFALRRAAEFEQIISGTNALASSIGEAGSTIIQNIQDITKGQLSLVEAAQTANLALASGFGTEQIDALTEVSLRASKALGRNLSDSFTRVVRGAAKLEPELLDELGIFTRIDPAVRKYADSIGVSVTSLTNFERRQAFVNAVIEEGRQKFRDVDTDTETSAQSLERLGTAVVDTGLKFGALLANALSPVADFISGNLSNTFALFGILARVVGAQAISVFDTAIRAATSSIINFGERAATGINNLSMGFTKAQASAQKFAAASIQFSRFGKQEEVQRRMNVQALLQEVAATDRLTKSRYDEIRASLIQARTDQLNIASRIKNTVEVQKARAAAFALGRRIVLLDKAQKAAIPGTVALTTAIRGLGVAVGFVGATFNRLFGIITTIITALSVLQLVVDGVAKALGFDNFSILEKVADLFQKLIGLFTESTTVAEDFVQANKGVLESTVLVNKGFEERKKILDDVKDKTAEFLTEYNRLTNLDDAARTTEALRLVTRQGTDEAKAGIRAVVNEINSLGKGSTTAGINILNAVRRLTEETGIASNKFIELLKNAEDVTSNFSLSSDAAGNLIVKLGDIEQQITTISEDGVVEFLGGLEKAGPILGTIAQKLTDFYDEFRSGALNSERAAQRVGAIQSLINRLIVERNVADAQGLIPQQRRLALLIEESQIQLTIAQALGRQITQSDKLSQSLRKVFGTPGEKISRLGLTGDIGAGGIATSGREKEANQAERLAGILSDQVTLQKSLTRDEKTLVNLRQTIVDRIKAQEKILGNIAKREGENIKNNEDAAKIAKTIEEEKRRLLTVENAMTDRSSQFVEQQRAAKIASQQLLLIRLKVLSTIEKEIDNLQKQVNSLKIKDIQLTQKLVELRSKIALRAEQNITKELLAQNKARENFLKNIGALSASEDIQLTSQAREIQIAQAEKDKREAIRIAELKRKSDLAVLNLQVKTNEINIKRTTQQVRATNRLIKAISQNTATIVKTAGGDTKGLGGARLDAELVSSALALNQLEKENKKFNTSIFSNQRQLINDTANLNKLNAENSFTALKNNLDRELTLKKENARLSVRLFKGVNNALGDNLTKGLNEMFDAIAQGEFTLKSFREGFNQFLFNLLNDIRKQFLRETLIDPLKEGATGILKGVFGISSSASNVATGGNTIGNTLSGFSGAPNPDAFFASGGPVKLAAGGMMRDRVPALLEPGEFVMKRSSARSIGAGNLSAMNATGQMGGNVSVNIVNQGTPQEATQQSQPRFDGEKFVIDIVTRDLRNNGPIRKSLRGAS